MPTKKSEKKEPLKNANKHMPELKKKADEKSPSTKKSEQSKDYSGCC
ncbi:MAG: hypothetical protein ACXVLQ_06635 [Bacteriovorax sp.]